MVTISKEHAYSLSRMVKWFQSMIVEHGIGTSELTEGYCEELIEVLQRKEVAAKKVGVVKKPHETIKDRGGNLYYSHFCFTCHCCFVSDKRNARCWSCNSDDTINGFDERFKEIRT